MPYLNVDLSYPEHPKTIKLKVFLGEMADALPVRLWAYCARVHPETGNLGKCSVAEFEAIINWHGKPGLAAKVFLEIGLIERTKNGFVCHDWLEHEGHLKAFRRRSKIANQKRWKAYYSAPPTRSPSRIPKGLQNDTLGVLDGSSVMVRLVGKEG